MVEGWSYRESREIERVECRRVGQMEIVDRRELSCFGMKRGWRCSEYRNEASGVVDG